MTDTTFWEDQVTSCQARLVAAQELQLTLLSDDTPAQKAYTLNTGQTTISVTKSNMGVLHTVITSLINQCATLSARVDGATIHGVPGW